LETIGFRFFTFPTLASNHEVKEKAEELGVVEVALDHDWVAAADGRHRRCFGGATRRVQEIGH